LRRCGTARGSASAPRESGGFTSRTKAAPPAGSPRRRRLTAGRSTSRLAARASPRTAAS
ncbi:unnamed protein product, partial [Prorocentrum cordatum]